jgi:hypothetical protein
MPIPQNELHFGHHRTRMKSNSRNHENSSDFHAMKVPFLSGSNHSCNNFLIHSKLGGSFYSCCPKSSLRMSPPMPLPPHQYYCRNPPIIV